MNIKMKNKILFLLFCVAATLTTSAQRKVPTMLIHLKDGSTDTIYIENNFVRFYGLDNPKPGDFVTLNVDGSYIFPYDNTDINNKRYKELKKANASLTVEGEAFPGSFYTGTILSTKELDDSFLTDEFLRDYKNKYGMMYLVDCKDIISNYSPISLPYDGTTYYAYAFAISEDDSSNRFLSNATVIKAYADSWYITWKEGYEFYEKEENKAIALNCNYDQLTSSCKQDMPWLPDNNLKSAIQTYLKAMKFDFSSYTKAATTKRDCTDAMLYFVDNITAQTKEDISQAINNVSVTDNSLYNVMAQSGINSDITDFASKELTYSIDKENSSLVDDTEKYSAITLKQNLSPSVFGADIATDKGYTMLLPNSKAFSSVYDAAKPYYKYITSFNYMDVTQTFAMAASITSSTAPKREIVYDVETYSDAATISNAITKNIVFDNSVDANKSLLNGTAKTEDVLISATGRQLSNVPAILAHTKKHSTANNGTLYEMDEMPFKSWETYNPALEYHTPLRTIGLKNDYVCSEYTLPAADVAARDTLLDNVPDFLKKKILSAKDGSLSYICTDSINFSHNTAKPEVDFALNNVRSTKYHIYVVTAPAQVKNPEQPIKPLYARIDLAYNAADGSQQYERLNIPGAANVTDDIIVHNDGKLGVIELEVEFPICYEGLKAHPTLFMSHTKNFTTFANRNRYDRELRIVGVYLISEDEIQSLNK